MFGFPDPTYDPATFPSWENAFINAKATARLDAGRGTELLIQAINTTNPAYDWAIRNLLDRQTTQPLCLDIMPTHNEM